MFSFEKPNKAQALPGGCHQTAPQGQSKEAPASPKVPQTAAGNESSCCGEEAKEPSLCHIRPPQYICISHYTQPTLQSSSGPCPAPGEHKAGSWAGLRGEHRALLTHQLRLQADVLGSLREDTHGESENGREETLTWHQLPVTRLCWRQDHAFFIRRRR